MPGYRYGVIALGLSAGPLRRAKLDLRPFIVAVQADPAVPLRQIADLDPVQLHPEADIVEVTTRMADYDLLTLPVVDHHHRIVGLITVDDALESRFPDWRRLGA